MKRPLFVLIRSVPAWLFVLINLHCGRTPTSNDNEADFQIPPTSYQGRFAKDTASSSAVGSVVYLNFNGGVIAQSSFYGDESQNNQSFIPTQNSTIPTFDSTFLKMDRTTAINQVVASAQAIYAAYNVTFTSSRPSVGNYKMMMIGGTPASIGNSSTSLLGISPVDFKNQNPNDVGFIFSAAIATQKLSLTSLVNTIAHETGHTFGLQHITPGNDIMHSVLLPVPLIWGQGPLSSDNSQTQNDNQVLTASIGLKKTQVAPPSNPFQPITPPAPPRINVPVPPPR